MKKIILTLFSLIAIQALTFGQQDAKTNDGKTVLLYEDGSWMYADSVPLYNIKPTIITKLEIPKTNPKDVNITHTGYSFVYNEEHEQASWIGYELTKEETNKLFERTNKFLVDPKVKTGTANDKDYKGSGYDRGHLAPASDMGYSATSMAESFYFSNMSPQLPGFNRGIWKRLEELVRTWAVENNNIYIVTGGVLTSGLPTIGGNKVSVPKYYYKVILDYTAPSIKGICFILPNGSSGDPLENYAVTIDSVEKLTGIDFYPNLPDDQETEIEKTLCIKCWSWKGFKSEYTATNESTTTGADTTTTGATTTTDENRLAVSVQCKGITKAGERCKNKTLNLSEHCYHHEGQINSNTKKSNTEEIKSHSNEPTKSSSTSVQCSGTTKSGSRCKRRTTSSSGRCYQH